MATTRLRWRVSAAAVGLSSFSELTGSLNYSGARQIEVSSGKFSLDVAQTKNLLNRFALLPKVFGDVDFARGRLDVIALSLKGPLDQPSRWDFSSTGTVQGIAAKTAKLPGVMNVSAGKVQCNTGKTNGFQRQCQATGRCGDRWGIPGRPQRSASDSGRDRNRDHRGSR